MDASMKSGIIAACWMFCGACVGFNLAWGIREWSRMFRWIYRRMRSKASAPAPHDAPRVNGHAAEASSPATPGAERVKRPFAESGDNRSGNGADNRDDDGFHADIVPQKQEARQ